MKQLRNHIDNLTADQRQEFLDLLDYLGEKGNTQTNPSARLPEGNLANLVMRASPQVRQTMFALHEELTTARNAPFEQPMCEAEVAHHLGLDPDAALNVLAAWDGLTVTGKLLNKMGDDTAPPVTRGPGETPEHFTLKDDLKRATALNDIDKPYNHDLTMDGMHESLSNAAEHLSLRETLSTVMENTPDA